LVLAQHPLGLANLLGQPDQGFWPPAAPPTSDYDGFAHPQVHVTLTARGAALAEGEPDLDLPIERGADGAAELRLCCPPGELDGYARFLGEAGRTSLGAEVQVEMEVDVRAPPELRAGLRQLGQLLAERYAPV
jgi:hypothetical protein